MKKLIIFVSMMLTSTFAKSASCPTKEFAGNFKVAQIRGCEDLEGWNQLTHVENLLQDNDVIIGLGFNNQNISLKFGISEDSNNASSVECENSASEKFWLWFPQSPRGDFFWGFSKIGGEFYLDRGLDCSYRLQKI